MIEIRNGDVMGDIDERRNCEWSGISKSCNIKLTCATIERTDYLEKRIFSKVCLSNKY